MALAKTAVRAPTVVLDVVPHRIYEAMGFAEFLARTKHVDILISEVATMRRFLGLGNKADTIDKRMALDTAERIGQYFPRTALRYGPSGCDEEILTDRRNGKTAHRATGHDRAADKRGYGDRLALSALSKYFQVLPPT
jgi:hypothetical protein